MSPRGGGGNDNESRRIRFSQVEFYKGNQLGPSVTIGAGRFQAFSSAAGAELIGNVSEGHNLTRTCSNLMMVNSETHPGDLVAIPTNEDSDDNLKVEWFEAGKYAVIDCTKLLVFKKIQIPANSNMHIPLVEDEDSVFGKGVRFQLVGATFEVKEKRPRKKKAAPPPGTAGPTAPAGTSDTQAPAANGPEEQKETEK